MQGYRAPDNARACLPDLRLTKSCGLNFYPHVNLFGVALKSKSVCFSVKFIHEFLSTHSKSFKPAVDLLTAGHTPEWSDKAVWMMVSEKVKTKQ